MIGNESWLNPNIYSSEVFPPEYNVFRKDRSDGYGGVFIACHNKLTTFQLTLNENTSSELIATQIQLDNTSIIICAVYRPPKPDSIELANLCASVSKIMQDNPTSTIYVAGDFNLPNINWQTQSVSGYNYPIELCDMFIDFLANNGLTQMVNFTTRLTNILDLFITNMPSLILSCKPLPGISDHEIVFIQALIRIKPQICTRSYKIWHKADKDSIHQAISIFNDEFLSSNTTDTPVDTLWFKFKNICHLCLDKIPSKTANTNTKRPWINRHIKRLTRHKQKAYNFAKSNPSTQSWAEYRRIKKETQKQCRKSYNTYVNKLVDPKVTKNTKALWSFIKSNRKDHCGVPILQDSTGPLINEPHTKANLLNDYFCSVFTKEDDGPLPNTTEQRTVPDMEPIIVTEEGVVNLLNTLQPNKASGPDKIPSRFLKEYGALLSPVLTLIFQASLNQGKLPSDWKYATIVPAHKKGDRKCPSNYRPISLTCVCCKLLEHVIYSSISTHWKAHNVVCEEQHGFQQSKSCETQLIYAVNDFAKTLNRGEETDCLFLDFSKAFDKVPHRRLLLKLDEYGLCPQVLTWIKDFLSGRMQSVALEGNNSDTREVLSGVPQGTVLAPLLFTCYVNDIPSIVKSKVRLYADDILLYRTIHTYNDCLILQEDLNSLIEWSNVWLMSFNPTKCVHLKISNKQYPSDIKYYINQHQIERSTHATYLGVTIDEHLKWTDHVDKIVAKANATIGFLKRNFSSCNLTVKKNCYLTMVQPILDYACTVWKVVHTG